MAVNQAVGRKVMSEGLSDSHRMYALMSNGRLYIADGHNITSDGLERSRQT
jgi:hypothetical protein